MSSDTPTIEVDLAGYPDLPGISDDEKRRAYILANFGFSAEYDPTLAIKAMALAEQFLISGSVPADKPGKGKLAVVKGEPA